MANNWKVKFVDDEMPDEQTASFQSKKEAFLWIKNQEMQERYDPTGFKVVDGPYEDNITVNEAKNIDAMFAQSGLNSKIIYESWDSSFDDKPENQFGERWKKLDTSNYAYCAIADAIRDCQLDPEEDGPKVDKLSIANVHIVDGGNLIVSMHGGANGASIEGQCNFKNYLALVKKLVGKLVANDSIFEDAWLLDWENDCCDDTYAIRIVLKPNEKNLTEFKESGMLEFAKDDANVPAFDPQTFIDAAKEHNIDCHSAEATHGTSIRVDGSFPDEIPLDYLIFNWHPISDQYADRGWYQGIRCKNRWNAIVIDVLNSLYPNGIQPVDQLKNAQFKQIDALNESNDEVHSYRIWIDDVRPAPNGYVWIKSVNEFIDWMVEHGVQDVEVVDLDHDAGEYASDGGDYIRCLDWLEFQGVDSISIRIHSANPVGVQKMRAVIKKNQWNEVFDIIDEDDVGESMFDGGDYDALALDEADKADKANEAEDMKSKDKIIASLKKASKDFQKAASNYDPEKFSKIVVALDDITSGIGSYDFKKKKVFKEDESVNDTKGNENGI